MINFTKRTFNHILVCLILFISSCGSQDEINTLKNRVDNLEDAVKSLQHAFDSGKTISTVTRVNADAGGYLITFSDGSTITLGNGKDGADGINGVNGADGVTPMISIDSEGYWVVSYDDGARFSPISDNYNNPLTAKGLDGICVRVAVIDGHYAFQLYTPDDPERIIETITTPYSSDPASALQSIVEDPENGTITLTLADGGAFRFNLDISYPTGIVLLTDHVDISGKDRTATFEFRINPSNSFINFIYEGEDANIQLDRIATSRAGDADSYVTLPTNYRITDVTPSLNEMGERKVGQYTVTVKSDAKDADGEEIVALVITTKDGRGNSIQISSTLMSVSYDTRPQIYGISVGGIDAVRTDATTFHVKLPYGTVTEGIAAEYSTNSDISIGGAPAPETLDLSNPVTLTATLNGISRDYTLVAHYSNLPIVYVSTPAPIVSKDDWIKESSIRIANAGEYNAIYESAQLKGRGNSTWIQPKKPYAIKLDKKAGMLGKPAHKRWVLLANYMDKSNLRTEAAMYLGRHTDMDYTPRTEFVELVLNGEYQGLYQLTEQMKIDENRVDAGDDGFLLEVDVRAGEDPEDVYFEVDYVAKPLVIKDPDVEYGSEDFEYIKSYIESVSSTIKKINDDNNNLDYLDLIDVESFIDWYLVNEITKNNDAHFYSSCYMHLKRGDKLKMGPIWDFDLAIGNSPSNDSENPKGFWIRSVTWFNSLFKSKDFVNRVKEKFNKTYKTREKLYSYIREQRKHIQEANIGDELKWSRFNVGSDSKAIDAAFDENVEEIIDWLETRFIWMKSEFDKL